MIWSSDLETSETVSVLFSYLVDELSCVSDASPMAPHEIEELSRGVLTYGESFIQRNGISSDYLTIMTARALWSVRRTGAARELLEKKYNRSGKKQVVEFLENGAHRNPPGWELIASRTLRPAEYVSMVPGHSWIVDFRRVTVENPVVTELMMARMVRPVIETALPVWDEGAGRGELGLMGLGGHLIRHGSNRNLIQAVTELSEWILSKAARERKWAEVPRVLLLDL